MATTTNAATFGLSNAELDAELLNELPEREEMCGFHRWHNYSCWHPCYEYPSCYEYHPIETFSSSYTSVTSYSQVLG